MLSATPWYTKPWPLVVADRRWSVAAAAYLFAGAVAALLATVGMEVTWMRAAWACTAVVWSFFGLSLSATIVRRRQR